MTEGNWKTWALIFIAVIGIAFEAIKRLPSDSSNWSIDNLRFSSGDSPYQVKYNRQRPPDMIPMMANTASRLGGATVSRETLEKFAAANAPHKGEFNHDKGAEGKAQAKKKNKDDDEWEIIVDPKTGKRYKRRKKKKIAKVEEVKFESPYKEETKKPEVNDEDISGLMNQAIGGGSLPTVGPQDDSAYADLEEWKRRLLTRPDATETRRFIEAYNSHMVSAEIFYKIVAMMLEDSRPSMKELGVLCAGLTPSVLSFQLLAEITKTERSGSSLRSYAESFLDRYSDLNNLSVVKSIFVSPPSSYVTVQAAKRFDTAANHYLASTTTKSSAKAIKSTSTTTSSSTTTTKQSANVAYFRSFLTVLDKLSRNSDAAISEQAKSSLTNLRNLMNLSEPPTQVIPGTGATKVSSRQD